MGAFAEVLHNSSLMIDDIEDSSIKRRGIDCCHVKFGVPTAISAGNTLYFVASKWALEHQDTSTRNSLLFDIMTEMGNLHLGQNQDISWNRKHISSEGNYHTEAGYITLCKHKTSGLLRLITKCCINLASSRPETEVISQFSELMDGIGVLFQIVDDLLNLSESKVAGNKAGRGEDIREGNKSIIVIHALKNAEAAQRDRLIAIINARTDKQEEIEEAIQILEQSGSIDYTLKFVAKLREDMLDLVGKVFKKRGTVLAFRSLIDYIVNRKN